MCFWVHAQASYFWKWIIAFRFLFHHCPASGVERIKQTRPRTHEPGSYEARAGSREGSNGLEAARVAPFVRRTSQAESRTKGGPNPQRGGKITGWKPKVMPHCDGGGGIPRLPRVPKKYGSVNSQCILKF